MSVIFNIHSQRRAAAALSIMLLAQAVLTGCSVSLPWQKSETAQEAEPAAETAAAETAAEGAGAAENETTAQDAATGQGQTSTTSQTPSAAHSSESAAAAASDSEGSAAGTQSGSDREGAVLNIYAWDDSLRSILVQYYSEYHEGEDGQGMIGNMQVNWVILEPEDYQEELDKHLLQNSYTEADEKVDLYLVDGDSLVEEALKLDANEREAIEHIICEMEAERAPLQRRQRGAGGGAPPCADLKLRMKRRARGICRGRAANQTFGG